MIKEETRQQRRARERAEAKEAKREAQHHKDNEFAKAQVIKHGGFWFQANVVNQRGELVHGDGAGFISNGQPTDQMADMADRTWNLIQQANHKDRHMWSTGDEDRLKMVEPVVGLYTYYALGCLTNMKWDQRVKENMLGGVADKASRSVRSRHPQANQLTMELVMIASGIPEQPFYYGLQGYTVKHNDTVLETIQGPIH